MSAEDARVVPPYPTVRTRIVGADGFAHDAEVVMPPYVDTTAYAFGPRRTTGGFPKQIACHHCGSIVQGCTFCGPPMVLADTIRCRADGSHAHVRCDSERRIELPRPPPADYLLLSTKWTRGESITWWGPESTGYTTDLNRAGRYTKEDATRIAHPDACIAVPVAAVVETMMRTSVPIDHLLEILRRAGVCATPGCRERPTQPCFDPRESRCALCIAGDAGLIHLFNAVAVGGRSETWCGLPLLGESGHRSRESHERVYHQASRSAEEITCGQCRAPYKTHLALRATLHVDGCDHPYCEGCRAEPGGEMDCG